MEGSASCSIGHESTLGLFLPIFRIGFDHVTEGVEYDVVGVKTTLYTYDLNDLYWELDMQFELYYGEGFVRRMCFIDGNSRDCTTLSGFEEIPSNSAVFNIPKLCRIPDLPEFNSFR
ncbi:hypothetical protein GEMRC1_001092 [Eukaryota sp. GEM-RC1]